MDVKPQSLEQSALAANRAPRSDGWAGFGWFLVKLLVVVMAFRVAVFSPFSIPSESMLPQLMNGDYLLAAKWPYGLSRHSLPFDMPLSEGRIMARTPARGDIVIFKHPVDGVDYIKRVIALPGDRVAVIGGEVVLNGTRLARERQPDASVPMSANTTCAWGGTAQRGAGDREVCRYTRYRETLPGGPTYETLDFGPTPYDGFAERVVPPGTLFVMGDNRDNSRDSRFAAMAGDGVGFVPQGLLVGRATIIIWSTDGSAEWAKPWTWFAAARWDRIGATL